MFRAMAILLLSYSMTASALESPDLLLSCFITTISIALYKTIILIIAYL